AARHADMDFMSLTKGQGCRGHRGLEGGFLGGVSALDVAVMQHAPDCARANPAGHAAPSTITTQQHSTRV
ncbi:MAG TPA: hypothetical protein PKE29_03050, partial [Phycisphaerales bacterium]|nr:hypothetical protein [Phycisphaerales bacterium]